MPKRQFPVLMLSIAVLFVLVSGVIFGYFLNRPQVASSPSKSVAPDPLYTLEATDHIYRWSASTSTALFLTQVNQASNVLIIDVVNSTALMPLQRTMLVMEATRISAFNIQVLLTVTAYYRTPESLRTADPTAEPAYQPTPKLPEALILEWTATHQH